MNIVIVINGMARAGKDTFVKFCQEEGSFNVINYSSVQPIKDIAKSIGWDGKKTEKDRKFLSDLKELLTEYNDLPFVKIKEQIDNIRKSDNNMLFVHIREPKEIQKVCDLKNEYDDIKITTLFINNDRVKQIESNNSDAKVREFCYDFYVNNNQGLEELKYEAQNFIRKVNL